MCTGTNKVTWDVALAVCDSGRPRAALILLDQLGVGHSDPVFIVEQRHGTSAALRRARPSHATSVSAWLPVST